MYVGDGDKPTLVREVTDAETATDSAEPPDELADRRRRLREETEDIERGCPAKYRQRLAEQGKLFVRDRFDHDMHRVIERVVDGETVDGLQVR